MSSLTAPAPTDRAFDLTRGFLPGALARTAELVSLAKAEQRLLNQLRARRHVAMLATTTAAWIRAGLSAPITSAATAHLAALDRFGADLATALDQEPLAGGPVALPRAPLAAALLLLHQGYASQLHHAESLHDPELEPRFRALLATHWQIAAQQLERVGRHLDDLAPASRRERIAAVDACLAHLAVLEAGLGDGVADDLARLRRITGRRLGEREHARALAIQRASCRWNHLGAGLTHPRFTQLVARFAPERAVHVAALAAACL